MQYEIGPESDFALQKKKKKKVEEKLLKTVDNIMWPSVLTSLDVLVKDTPWLAYFQPQGWVLGSIDIIR